MTVAYPTPRRRRARPAPAINWAPLLSFLVEFGIALAGSYIFCRAVARVLGWL